MREIVLDTETTGLDPGSGHRIVEVGCVELLNHVPTGRTFHSYVNPERSMPAEAFAVHGLSEEFLATQAPFAEVAAPLLDFLADSPLVIHNAAFDLAFLNAELARLNLGALAAERAIDTVKLARQRFPGLPANLDALCRRFGIDNSDRAQHGALKDALLLAAVYLELKGGRQPGLALSSPALPAAPVATPPMACRRTILPTVDEAAAHAAFLGRLSKPLWHAEG